jgi:hypothetical protein
MAWVINQNRDTGGWYVEDTDTGKKYYAGDPGAAISDAIREGGMPASLRSTLNAEADAIIIADKARIKEIQRKQQEEADAQAAKDAERAKQAEIPPPASAAAAVATSGEGATQHPPAPPETATGRVTPTQAATLAGGTPAADSGTNAATRTLEQTQSVPAQPAQPAQPTDTNREKPTAGGKTGVGAANEDQTGTRATTKIILNKFSDKITPEPNVLDQYASYTYSISWYLLEPGSLENLKRTGKLSLAGFNLLMQSGGAAAAEIVATETESANIGGRNARFPLDYYLDNLEIDSNILGGKTGNAHNVSRIKFTVTEPNGITLLNNLYLAVQDVYKQPGLKYEWAHYALVIRFYGYDSQGNLVQARAPNTQVTDRSAVVEKVYPFVIDNIRFRVANRLVEYNVEASPLVYTLGYSQYRGTVKEQMRVSGSTVKDLLGGFSDASAQSAANAASDGRPSRPAPEEDYGPPVWPADPKVADLPMPQQAAIAAGTDPNAVNPAGMAFGGGGL